MDTAANTITCRVTFTGALSGGETAADIHGFAGPGGTAAALYGLPLGATKDGVITYNENEEAPFLSDFGYVEIASAGFPGGEIRARSCRRRRPGTTRSTPTASSSTSATAWATGSSAA